MIVIRISFDLESEIVPIDRHKIHGQQNFVCGELRKTIFNFDLIQFPFREAFIK